MFISLLLFCLLTARSDWVLLFATTTPLENVWRILLYVTDEATAKLYSTVCDVKFRQIEGNGRTFYHIQLSNSIITQVF